MMTCDDLHAFASLVSCLGTNESEIGRIALACALRNRFEAQGYDGPGRLARFCRNLMAPSPDDDIAQDGCARQFADPEFRRCLAISCQVWNDELADPTSGATHFHRHDELPNWAHHLEPAALLGSHFFYVLPKCEALTA